MHSITSRENKRFKLWKKIHAKKERDKQGLFLAEGDHLVEEALTFNWGIVDIMVREGYAQTERFKQMADQRGINFYSIAPALFDEIAETKTPQGVMVVLKKPQLTSFDLSSTSLVLMVDEVRDPGNLGTLIRTADAAGVSAILLGKGTTDPFAPKVVRSTQGSLFHVPVYQVDLPLVVSQLKEEHWLVVGTSLHEAIDLREFKVKPDQKVAVVVGNEARGISPYVEQITDFNVKIPLFGGAESLNVSVAAGIVLYYVQFQRKGLNL